MVDSIVGLLLLAVIALSVSAAFSTLARLEKTQSDRIDRLEAESDMALYANLL